MSIVLSANSLDRRYCGEAHGGHLIYDLLSNGIANELIGGVIDARRRMSKISEAKLSGGSHLAVA